MTPLSVDDLVLDPVSYAGMRPSRRAEAIALRQARRVQLGELVGLEFENSQTLHYQAQEMLYVERVTDPGAAEQEIAVYARLQPSPQLLTATLFIEVPDQAVVRAQLAYLDGLHDAVRLEIGTQVCPARDIPPPDEGPATHTVSVHFLGFDLSPAAAAALAAGEPSRVVIDHPVYPAETALSPAQVTLLARDAGLAD